jgi:hypothetical protein
MLDADAKPLDRPLDAYELFYAWHAAVRCGNKSAAGLALAELAELAVRPPAPPPWQLTFSGEVVSPNNGDLGY